MSAVPEGFLVREKLIAVTQKVEVIEGAALLPAERFEPEAAVLLSLRPPQMPVRYGHHNDHRLHIGIPAGLQQGSELFDVLRPVVRRREPVNAAAAFRLIGGHAHVCAALGIVAAGGVVHGAFAAQNRGCSLETAQERAGIDVDTVLKTQEALHVGKPFPPGVEARNGDLITLGIVPLIRAGQGVVGKLDIHDLERIAPKLLFQKIALGIHGKHAAREIIAAAVQPLIEYGGSEAVPCMGGADHKPVQTPGKRGPQIRVHDNQGLRAVIEPETEPRDQGEGQQKAQHRKQYPFRIAHTGIRLLPNCFECRR